MRLILNTMQVLENIIWRFISWREQRQLEYPIPQFLDLEYE